MYRYPVMEEDSPGENESAETSTDVTRPDRVAKLLEKKTHEETIVKCCLQRAIIDKDNKWGIVEEIEKRVLACSRRTHLATIALNLIVHEALENNTAVPQFWDVTFIRQLMLGTQSAHDGKEYQEIADLFARYPSLLHDVKDRQTGDGNIYTHAAKKLVVNIKNHLTLNTPKILKNVLYQTLENKDQGVLALYAVNGWKRPAKLKKKDPEMTQATKDLVERCREVLRLQPGKEMGKKWFKEEFESMVRFRMFAIRHMASLPKPRMYTLLPLARIKRHFITLDTMGFWGICKDIGFLDNSLYSEEFEKMLGDHWRSIFNVAKTEGKHCKFTGTVDTDGIAINIHYKRPKRVNSTPEELVIDPKKHRILGNDPGRVNIYYMAEELPDGTFRYYILTRAQYYRDSGAFEAIQKSNLWNLNVKEEMKILSERSPKVTTLAGFLQYVDAVMATKEAFWEEYLKPRWARQRLRTYGGKKRVFANFFNRVEKDTPKGMVTVVSYGSAKFAPGGKGEISAPVGRAYKECSSRMITKYTDEFRSTRVYYGDGKTILEAVGCYKKYQKVKVRGLLWCESTNSKFNGKLVNRDLNAALNIRRCLTDRPDSMMRSKNVGSRLSTPVIRRMLRDSEKKNSGRTTTPRSHC